MVLSRLGLALAPLTADAPHDLYLAEDGNIALAHDAEVVGQHARQRLMTFAGEWFLDTTIGVRWLQEIMGRQQNLPLAEALVKSEILDTDGVTAITSFSIGYERTLRRIDVTRTHVATVYDDEVLV